MLISFFKNKKWSLWAYGGLFLIIILLITQTYLDVLFNSWYRDFYDLLQTATEREISEFWDSIIKFLYIANKFYKSLSMNPIMVKKELPGYLADRLQEALWREALHIVNEGYASTEDLDRSIEDGPGLRWSLMGIFLTYHLAGGKAGMKHMLEQFGPALKLPWTKLKAPVLSKELSSRVITGTRKQARGKSIEKISNIRDEYLVSLLKMRKKFETKLR